MKAADFEKVINEYAKSLTNYKVKEGDIKVRVYPVLYVKKWAKGEHDRTYLNVKFEIDVWVMWTNNGKGEKYIYPAGEQRKVYFECGFINDKTARYNVRDKIDFRASDAFETVKEIVAELKILVAIETKKTIATIKNIVAGKIGEEELKLQKYCRSYDIDCKELNDLVENIYKTKFIWLKDETLESAKELDHGKE